MQPIEQKGLAMKVMACSEDFSLLPTPMLGTGFAHSARWWKRLTICLEQKPGS